MRVLVVDDNRSFAESMKDVLELEGHSVASAFDGREALEIVQREPFDRVYMDLVMPAMDGVAAIRAIRQLPCKVPITVMTGFGEEHKLSEALKAGANGVIGKPLDFERLLSDLSRC